ncbi:MAG: hypothetical protein JO147_03185, partial [Actinobacteria bacterium]|nr:hypothetical protein [Actinomycetota bacterium]
YMGHYLATVGFGDGYAPAWSPPGAAVALVLLAALGLVAWLGLACPYKPRVAQLAFLSVLAFLLTTKVWSPQYSVWLVPLVALARPRWRLNLFWQFSEIAVWVATLLWLDSFNDANRGIEYGWLMLTLIVRDLLLLAIAAFIVYEMWHPETDVVRSDGLDDPAGGCFDGLPDAPYMNRRRRHDQFTSAEMTSEPEG